MQCAGAFHTRLPHLILGGTGFIGRHVAVAIARSGDQVTIASRFPPRFEFPADVRSLISWVCVDVVSADWPSLLRDVRSVHHYAWASVPATAQENPVRDIVVNLLPLISLLTAMRELPSGSVPLIFASSGGTVYGKLSQIPVAETHELGSITTYGATKVAAEQYLRLYAHLYGVDVRIARISNPYGGGQSASTPQGVIAATINRALHRESVTIWGDGSIVRDFIYIADVVDALVALAAADPRRLGYSEFNVGTGEGSSIRDVIETLEAILQYPVMVRYESGRDYDVPVSVLDVSRAKRVLSWEPRVSLLEGMKRTVDSFRCGSAFSD